MAFRTAFRPSLRELGQEVSLIASMVGEGSMAAAVQVTRPLVASMVGEGSMSANLRGGSALINASMIGESSMSASVTRHRGLVASAVGESTFAAEIFLPVPLVASLIGESSMTANLKKDVVFSASMIGEGSMSASFITFTPVGFVIVTATPPYRVVIAEIDGPELEEVPFKNLQMSWALNEPGGIGFTLPLTHPKTTRELLDPGKREIHVYRENVPIWGGYLWTAAASTDNPDVRFSGEGYFSWLLRRYVDVDKDWVDLDQLQIAWNLINFTQNAVIDGVSGDLGITRADPAEASGVVRTRRYRAWNRPNIGTLLKGFTELSNGFDWNITPTKEWETFYPSRGNDTDEVFELGKNIGTLAYDIDATQTVSEVTGLGSGERAGRCIVVASNANALNEFGILQKSIDLSNIKKYATLEERTIQELRKYKKARSQPQLTAVTDDPPFGSYGIGDRRWVRADKGFMQIDRYLSIVNMLVQVANSGRESTQLFFDEVLV